MRFLAIVKGSPESESGGTPSTSDLKEMNEFNEEMVNAGVMLAGEGLLPSARGARIRYDGDDREVVNGPFANAEELVAGFWIVRADSLEDAIAWLKRAPFREGEVELRPLAEDADFGDAITPELREQERRLREGARENEARGLI